MASDRAHKRSWKNLLINKSYQLRFTLFMVGLSAVLMVGLGIWIMIVANETTKVAITSERGKSCPTIPTIQAPDPEAAVASPPAKLPDPPAASGAEVPVGEEGDDGARKRPKISVTLDAMELSTPIQIIPPVPGGQSIEDPRSFGRRVVDHWTCELQLVASLQDLESGRLRILLVLIGAGILLVMGLAAYGITMTHKVAGPLFKVQLYLAKMRDGRFDEVDDLRKGDQLVAFYHHFKRAHAGVVALERSDIERLERTIAAAEGAGAGDHPSIVELRAMLERKVSSLA